MIDVDTLFQYAKNMNPVMQRQIYDQMVRVAVDSDRWDELDAHPAPEAPLPNPFLNHVNLFELALRYTFLAQRLQSLHQFPMHNGEPEANVLKAELRCRCV